jgi:hypothetical protein
MWEVSGVPPNLTVSPSIDVMRFVLVDINSEGFGKSVRDGSYWHGFITNGEIVG